jgi:hypothetical protein
MIFLSPIFLFYAYQLCSTPLGAAMQDYQPGRTYSIALNESILATQIHLLHENVLIPPESLTAINRHNVLSFYTKQLHVAGQFITRSTPVIDGIPVEGADGIFSGNNHESQFHFIHFEKPNASFRLSAAECMEKAITEHGLSTLKNPYVENTRGIYQPIWLMHFEELRPVFKIRLPTISIFSLKDIYVDAESGEILRIDDSAQFIQAPSQLFVYSPTSAMLDESELKPVMLPNLVGIEEGGFLQGEYMKIRNCCKFFTCPTESECTDAHKRCALKSHENAKQRREIVDLPSDTLGLDALISMPDIITVDTVRCTYLPFARASYENPESRILGFFDRPIDDKEQESEMDRFSEIQTYFSMMSFFHHIRLLLNDSTWCLRPEAMSCNNDGSPVVDEEGNPKNPYKVFVNQMIPDMKLEGPHQKDPDNFILQFMAGKGNRDNPIKLNQFARIGNAAFVPALSTLKKNAPRADEILSDLIKPYDHNVFFQGERDFALDGDVVFHEFMHAITTSLISKINSLGLDEWGIHSEPGSLNEAWADYFSAAFTNNPSIGKYASIKGGYGEVALRDIDNTASCPHDVIGEVHNDGLIWSGALWEIRSTLEKLYGSTITIEFDRAVLASLAEARITEDFKTQSGKLINNLKIRDGLGQKAADIAHSIFEKRGITNCFRAFTLSRVDNKNKLETHIKNLLFIPSKNQIELKNYAPSSSQLEIGIPAGAKGLTLSWRQFLAGTGVLLGTEATPNSARNIQPLKVIKSLDIPISWQFKNARAIPKRGNELIKERPQDSYYRNGYWQTYMPLDFDQCAQKTMYISLLSSDFKYVLENLNVDFDMDNSKDTSECNFSGTTRLNHVSQDMKGCSTTNTNDGCIIFMLCVLRMIHYRYKLNFGQNYDR